MQPPRPPASAAPAPAPIGPAGEAQLRDALAAAEARAAALTEQLAAASARAEHLEQQLAARTRAEQQQADQCAFYELVLEHLPVSVAVIDTEFRYVFANQLGVADPVARQQYRGQTVQALSELLQRPAHIVARRQGYLEQARAGQRALSWEETMEQADHQHSMLINIAPILGADNQPQYFIMTGLDITARKQAEEQVARQREFYEAILNHLPVQLVVFDAEQRFLFVNPAAVASPAFRQQMLGITHAEFLALSGRPPAQLAARAAHFRRAVQTGESISWEEDATTNEGQRRMLRGLKAVYDADGEVLLVVGSSIDITERYEAEEQHRRSETQLRTQQQFIRLIVDALPNVVYVITVAGEVKFRNAAFTALAAQSQHMRPPAEQNDAVRAQMAKIAAWRNWVFTTGQSLDAELALQLSSGSICHLRVHMSPFPQAEGGTDVLVVSTDITALKEANQAAEANAQAKEAFLARMSHEIRTPLNGMLGMVQLLRKMPLTPVQHEYLSIMQRSGRHLLALINDVLDLAKITAHHLALDAAPFDLDALLQGASEIVASLAEQKGLSLMLEPPPAPGQPLLGDAYRLQQILLNLLSNAIKFTARGSVRLGVALLPGPPAARRLRFWVQDTGAGIAPEQQERIFESFAQASSDTNGRFDGTGLGLAITEQLVRQMGGMLLLCSQPGAGSTFSFVLTLPLAPPAAPTAAPTEAPVTYEALRGLRVLLAEDNVVNQLIARALLEYWGVEVHTANTGTEALAQLTSQDFDAALLDIHMPGLSGVEVALALRRDAHFKRAATPLIALTANAFDNDRAAYLNAGMNGCVTKPFEEAELCDWLLRLTRRGPAGV
ncbi:PAS domain-containing hybrid sensor histidine kinase/response regulator [Hymenobacter convexus]|uniref:PAS domain-containing hybrid sensor histidine kinase/response regulator n=1 Tax=Hymenobacter sp. CA1UV-4 TaxID=3063782 RepID=UPI002712F131|nr:PAS domain-containing hybrid sensor histidine kinase/response regulator [Hymenobacter sp. CA1UV-4]MDO7850633.1 PAS domain-containing protein [Hymenobacter sp. CA1UV-4]